MSGKEIKTPLVPAAARIRRSIKLDRVNPYDLLHRGQIFACEQCSHFSATQDKCTMGFEAQFKHEKQMKRYNLTGFMAFCRFTEID